MLRPIFPQKRIIQSSHFKTICHFFRSQHFVDKPFPSIFKPYSSTKLRFTIYGSTTIFLGEDSVGGASSNNFIYPFNDARKSTSVFD